MARNGPLGSIQRQIPERARGEQGTQREKREVLIEAGRFWSAQPLRDRQSRCCSWLSTEQKQTGDGESYTQQPLPRWRFVKKHDPGDGHDGGATGQNSGHGRERPAFLKKKEE